MTKASTVRKDSSWTFKTTTPVNGFVTLNDLKSRAHEEGLLGQVDREEVLHKHWKGNRFFRLKIQRETTWIPFVSWLDNVMEDFGFAQLLNGLKNIKPFFGLKEWDKVRKRRVNDAWNLLPRVPQQTFQNGTKTFEEILRTRDHLYVDTTSPQGGDMYLRVKSVRVGQCPAKSQTRPSVKTSGSPNTSAE
jgi:hypothetical protein